MPRKKKKKKATKKKAAKKGTRSQFAGKRPEKKLSDHIFEIITKGGHGKIHSDTLVSRLNRMGFPVKFANIGRSVFSDPRMLTEGKEVRLTSRKERAARTTEVELTISRQSGERSGKKNRKGEDDDPSPRRSYSLTKPNISAAILVLDTVLDSKGLPDIARQKLLLTVRRLLGGKDEE